MKIRSIGEKIFTAFLFLAIGLQSRAFCSGGEESGGSISVLPDISVTVQIVNFLLLVLLLNIVLFKPIRAILAKRKEKIAGLEGDAKTASETVENKKETFDKKIKEARVESAKEKEALIAEAEAEGKKIISEINEKAQIDLASVKEKIKKEAGNVAKSLQNEVDNFAQAISEKLLGRAVV